MAVWVWAIVALAGAVAVGILLFRMVFVPWGTRWGATPDECQARMAGDGFFDEDANGRRRVVMTRAVSIAAPEESVWPWVAQLGRGAGFYSFDRIDNGGKRSAQHVVSWIPAPALGDASAIGYLRHVEPGRELAWWVPGERFLGADTRMVANLRVSAEGDGARLVIRMSADAMGRTAGLVRNGFILVDSLMARRQLLGIKERAERYGTRREDPERPETRARDQFQRYEVVYAAGGAAGVPGKERAVLWHERAVEDLHERFGRAASD